MSNKTTFEDLPEKVSTILLKVEQLEKIIKGFTDSREEPDDRLLTIKEASNFTSLANQTIYGLVSNRKIPFIKRKGSKRLYFSKKELRNWLMEERKNSMKPFKDNKHFRK